ncbi:MAG TPA: lipid-A-disaccharide synthase [Candidatus Omnitrophica bacterium]|nr:lipid-A-disaccharide synthase [Candidatus Omnitrophota bacterium]
MEKKILIVAGEASGDIHAANLVGQLKKIHPKMHFFGLGGKNMLTAGVDIDFDLTSLAVVGFLEILKHYPLFKKIFTGTIERTRTEKPDAAILVDYPGFNLRLAGELKKMGIPVIYFISPQVWAWGRKRIKFIRDTIGLMLVLFKFEEDLYKKGKFNVKFVGHPLLDIVKPSTGREALFDSVGFKTNFTTISLLPGSREREINNHLPVMLQAAQRIYSQKKDTQFFICKASTVRREVFKEIIDRANVDFPYKILDEATYDGVNASELVIVASGTATLETAILNKPMVIIYKVSFLTWVLAKLLVKIPNIGLVNVVAGKQIVPELVQFGATAKNISKKSLKILGDKKIQENMHAQLYALKNTLGMPGAYRRAAEEISKFLG